MDRYSGRYKRDWHGTFEESDPRDRASGPYGYERRYGMSGEPRPRYPESWESWEGWGRRPERWADFDTRQHERYGTVEYEPSAHYRGFRSRESYGYQGGGEASMRPMTSRWSEQRGYRERYPEYGHRFEYEEEPSMWERVKRGVKETFRGKGPKGFMRSDTRIHEDVCHLLTEHPEIDASEIMVSVANGEVTLTGIVDERHQKRLAEDMAEAVMGVRDVHNQIRLKRTEETTTQSQSARPTTGTGANGMLGGR